MLKCGYRCVAMKIPAHVMLILTNIALFFSQDVSNFFVRRTIFCYEIYKFNLVPGRVTDMTMIWQTEQKNYHLEWYNPQKTNAPITGYHVIVQYPSTKNRKSMNIEKTFYLNTAEKNVLPLNEVCINLFDKVNLVVL